MEKTRSFYFIVSYTQHNLNYFPIFLLCFYFLFYFTFIKNGREFQKNIYFCFIDYVKTFDCVDHNKLWKILKEMGIPDHLIRLLRNMYAGQEVTELDMEQQTGSK